MCVGLYCDIFEWEQIEHPLTVQITKLVFFSWLNYCDFERRANGRSFTFLSNEFLLTDEWIPCIRIPSDSEILAVLLRERERLENKMDIAFFENLSCIFPYMNTLYILLLTCKSFNALFVVRNPILRA